MGYSQSCWEILKAHSDCAPAPHALQIKETCHWANCGIALLSTISQVVFIYFLQLHCGPVQCQTSHTGLFGQYLPQSIHIGCLLPLRSLRCHRGMWHQSCHQSLGIGDAKWQSGAMQRRQRRCRVCGSQICRHLRGMHIYSLMYLDSLTI